MNRLRAVMASAALAAALPAAAQESRPTARQAMAQLVHEAMVPSSMASYGASWGSVSIRISRHMHWHLAGPDDPPRKTPASVRRNGWADASDEQLGVTAYGEGYDVESLAFDLGRWFEGANNDDDALAALKAAGVTTVATTARPNPFSESTAAWELSASGREPARLTRSTHCTPKGSAAAYQCSVVYELALKR